MIYLCRDALPSFFSSLFSSSSSVSLLSVCLPSTANTTHHRLPSAPPRPASRSSRTSGWASSPTTGAPSLTVATALWGRRCSASQSATPPSTYSQTASSLQSEQASLPPPHLSLSLSLSLLSLSVCPETNTATHCAAQLATC